MTVRLIFAQSSNGFIGKDGQLLFTIPEDMKVFKEKTVGSTVVMGRKTWESIPEKFRPLPKRRNIVVSSLMADGNPGVEVATSLKTAIDMAGGHGPIWIIGGEQMYKEGLQYADEIHETLVHESFEGDARAPVIDHHVWKRVSSSEEKSHGNLLYQFNIYVRKDHGIETQQDQEADKDRQNYTGIVRFAEEVGSSEQIVKLHHQTSVSGQFGSEEACKRFLGETACQGTCSKDDQARCAKAAGEAGLEAR